MPDWGAIMLHLRLFDSSLYYTLASASESSGLASSTSTERSFNGTQGAGGVAAGGESLTPTDVAAVNLTYFTPAISHVMLAPTTIATTTASATMVQIQTTAAPSHDLETGGNSTSSDPGEFDNLNSFYFYEVGVNQIKKWRNGKKYENIRTQTNLFIEFEATAVLLACNFEF